MSDPRRESPYRRDFLRFLASSPLLGLPSLSYAMSQLEPTLISTPQDALNVFDFEAVARDVLPPAHYGYMASGVDDDRTLEANREGFAKFAIRPRRLVDAERVDTTVELFGSTLSSPIFLSPVGGHRTFHPEGELAVARAARARDHLQILSTMTTYPVEQVAEARGGPVWFQLYPQGSLEVASTLVARAEAAGSPVIVLTIDLLGGRNLETAERFARADTRTCTSCHDPNDPFATKPMIAELPPSVAATMGPNSALDWDFVRRLRDRVRGRLVLKGIESGEDGDLAVRNGIDGIIVSNHGGRAAETGRGTIETLPEVVDAVAERIPVLVDGGFRRGTDVFKALALGARAVGIGRPYCWGLAAFGQPGVERVLEILQGELERVMRQSGVTSLDRVSSAYVIRR